MSRNLTPKQQRFVEEYLIDLNATAAYRRAGYRAQSETVATVESSRLLAKPSVAAAIVAAQQSRSGRTQIKADAVLRELAAVAFSDIGQVLDFRGPTIRLRTAEEIPEAARRALASVKVRRQVQGVPDAKTKVEIVEFRLWGKAQALQMLGRHLGLFVDKIAPVNPDGQTPNASGHAETAQLVAQAREALERFRARDREATAQAGEPVEEGNV